jgi:NAD binding domain of 6-phosphogluconate dehydrogenase
MSTRGQQRLLPQRNTNDRFTPISRHPSSWPRVELTVCALRCSALPPKVRTFRGSAYRQQRKNIVMSVSFIGLGRMGLRMAQRLLNAGHDLRVYNRTRSKAAILREAGARVCDTPRECAGAAAVIAMTADDASSQAVWLGADGVLSAQFASRAFASRAGQHPTASRPDIVRPAAVPPI